MAVTSPIGASDDDACGETNGVQSKHRNQIEGVGEPDRRDSTVAQAADHDLIDQSEAENEDEFEPHRYGDGRHPLAWAGRQLKSPSDDHLSRV